MQAVVADAARASGRGARLRGRLGATAQGDLSRPRHHRDGHRSRRADVVLHAACLGRRRRRARRHEGDRAVERRAALRSARRPARVVRQPAPALHGLEGPQRRACARTRCGAGSRSRSTASRRSRPATIFKTEDEDALYEFLGYQPIPPELRESSGELEAARRGELPELVELGDLRGDLHTHTHWSADGKNTLEEMVVAAIERGYEYYAITDHSHYLRDGRHGGAARRDRADARALPEAADPRRRRGEHPVERRGRRAGGRARAPRLGRRIGAQRAREPADRARARGDAEPLRRLHRAPDRQADQHARAARRRTSSA